MIYHLTASKDSYITDKIINGTSRAKEANTGYASTIDIFKLYNETTIQGSTDPQIEKSRGLISFDLAHLSSSIMESTGASAVSALINNDDLKIKLMLYDVQGTQVAPINFNLELWPVPAAWDEGLGDNIVTFGDKFPASWKAATTGVNWGTEGAWDSTATWTDYNGNGNLTYVATRLFSDGDEHLEMDVTTYVKSVWSGAVANDYGWLVKYSAAQEGNSYSYFVKRFASRHTRNPFLRPKLVATWNDYYIDERLSFDANTANAISIRNYSKGTPTALSSPTLNLYSGSWSREGISTTVVTIAGVQQVGMYEVGDLNVNLATSPYSDLKTNLFASGSLVLEERWKVGTDVVHSGSFVLNNPQANSEVMPKDYRFSVVGLQSSYTIHDNPVVRLFIRDKTLANEPVRIPIQLKSLMIYKMYYQIKDTNSEQVLIPFSDILPTPNETTRVSADSDGMFFKFPISVLPRGRTYTIDIAYYDRGERKVHEFNLAFRVK